MGLFTDRLANVSDEYRQVGTSILMENDRGQTRTFIVTHIDNETLTADGNNPLCGRDVVFTFEILTVRDATGDEMNVGGAIGAAPNVDASLIRPVSRYGPFPDFTQMELTDERAKALHQGS